jgi:hypothetical protein
MSHRSQEYWAKYKIEEMSREALLPVLQELTEEMDSIRAQIEKAKADRRTTGAYSDPDWFYRANTALRARGRLHQRIQMRLAQLKREEKADNVANAHTVEREFVTAAKSILPRETFERIMQIAQGRTVDGNHS